MLNFDFLCQYIDRIWLLSTYRCWLTEESAATDKKYAVVLKENGIWLIFATKKTEKTIYQLGYNIILGK